MNIKQKLTTAAVLGSMMLSVVAPASFASTTVKIQNNGAASTNKVKVKNKSTKTITQSNSTVVSTSITAKASTGGNTSSFNTGGTNSITTGDAANNVGVAVTGGSNTNSGNECGCFDPTVDATISDNGAASTNGVKVKNVNSSTVTQSNSVIVTTSVDAKASTGKNDSSFNTNGGGTIDTGDASNDIGVIVDGTTNTN